MAGAVSKTYGHALFELAVENGTVDQLLSEATTVQKALSENPDVIRFYTNPKITPEEKQGFTESVFGGRVQNDMTGLLVLAVRNGRSKEIPKMLEEIIAEAKEYKGIGIVHVETPTELSEAQKKRLEAHILATAGYRELEMTYVINPALIGGIVIRIGDRVVDGSIRSQLDAMSRELLQVSV